MKYEGIVLSVSEDGFLIIDDIKQGEKGIAVSEISDFKIKGGNQ